MEDQQINLDTNYSISKGRLQKWQILSDSPQIDCMVSLRHDEADLIIILRPLDFHGRYFKVKFDSAMCLRNTPEGLFLNGVDLIEKELWGTTFFTVANSAFVRQFHENSSGIYDDSNIIHYAIYTSNFCIDVLSIAEPSVTWVDDLADLNIDDVYKESRADN